MPNFNLMNTGYTGDPASISLRHVMRQIVMAWIFGAIWMYIATGAVMTQYAKLAGLSPFGFGLLAAAPSLAALVQLPTSYCLEIYGHRKAIFIWANLVHRFLWLVIAAIPWLFPGSWQVTGLISMIFVSSVLAHVASPAWMSWMADLVPSRLRGRYFSRRVQYGQFAGLLVTILVGSMLDWAMAKEGRFLLYCASAVLAVGAISGMIDTLLFYPIPAMETKKLAAPGNLAALVRKPFANPDFRRFLGYSFTMTFATVYIGQFIWLYVLDVVHMSNTRGNLLLISIPTLVTIFSYPLWGRMVDRFGSKAVLLLSGVLVINGGTSWVFVQGEHWLVGYVTVLIATFAWPGIDLAGFNLLLRMSGSKRGENSGTIHVAINSVVVAIAGTLSGLFGGIMAKYLESYHSTFFGYPLTFHGMLFLISGILRAMSLLWIVRLKEAQHYATRDVFHYMVAAVYSNVQVAAGTPVRLLGQLGRWSFKIGKYRPR